MQVGLLRVPNVQLEIFGTTQYVKNSVLITVVQKTDQCQKIVTLNS